MTDGSIQTPVMILGGYLGAGKTTLVNHLLRNADGKRLAILVNDFGDIAIDADLIEAQSDDIISLSGGCVCCSYGNDLFMAMSDLAKMEPAPDHVILEASGVALPGAIASSVSLLPDYCVEGIVVLADSETVRTRASDKYIGDTILRQLSDADILLMNKADLVDQDARASTLEWLRDVTDGCRIIETQHAQVDPQILLLGFGDGTGANYSHARPAHASQHATKFLEVSEPVEVQEFAEALLDGDPNLVRAKGFVPSCEGGLMTLQITGERIDISAAPAGAKPGLVTISLRNTPTARSA